jgi:imidazolonepropionase-like amidohydrolase
MKLPIVHCPLPIVAGTLVAFSLICPIHAETILLTGATIHPVSGATITNGDVLIQDGKIKGVFDASQPTRGTIPTDAKTIELKGLHLYPGMIALNTELGLVEIGAVRSTHDEKEVGEFTPEVQSTFAVNPDSELIPVARANGVAYFEPAPQGAVIAGHSGLVALDGWTSEQMTIKKPIALHIYWPGAGLDTTPRERARNKERWKSLADQDKERKEKIKALDDFFADARAYAKARDVAKDDATFVKIPSWEAMLPVVRGEIPLTIHADDVRQIRAAVKWAATNQFKMILAEGRDAWKAASLLASNNVPVIYNHIFTQPVRDSDSYDVHYSAPETLRKAGVKVVFSLSSYRDSLVKNLPYDAAQAVAFGFPEEEALKGITLYPAQLAGVADRLGSIEVNKDATLFVCDGDVLDIRSNVKRMWIAGKEVSLESRHTRLYEKYKNRPKTQ